MAPHDQRTKSAYIFGAIYPERGVGAALVLPRCDTQAMQWLWARSRPKWRPARTPCT